MSREPPVLDIDLYAPALLAEPYDAYRQIRDAAPVCRLAPYDDVYAMGRHADVRAALADWVTFSSDRGVSTNPIMNAALQGTVLGSDPPEHSRLKAVLSRPVTPQRLVQLRARMTELAEDLVERIIARGTFDAATELAQHLPLSVVSELVGLPEEGRQRMLVWAAAAFNGMGPPGNSLTESALPIMGEMVSYASDPELPQRLRPDGWAAELYRAVEAGEISLDLFQSMLQGYLSPSLDTTIFATTNLIWLFARHPEQWARLREQPALISRAINEAIRLESPVQGFGRRTTREVIVDGHRLPEGAIVLMLFAAANRDERKYPDPDRFDVTRDSGGHVGFGHAAHICVGMNLAKLEITALVQALLPRVERFELVAEKRATNNILRGFDYLQVRVC